MQGDNDTSLAYQKLLKCVLELKMNLLKKL